MLTFTAQQAGGVSLAAYQIPLEDGLVWLSFHPLQRGPVQLIYGGHVWETTAWVQGT